MSIQERVINFFKRKFSFSPADSDSFRREKLLNVFLFTFVLIAVIAILVPPIFILIGFSFGYEKGVLVIYAAFFFLLVVTSIIVLIKKYLSIPLANITFLVEITLIVLFVQTDINIIRYGVGIFWLFLPVFLTSLLFRSKWVIVTAIIALIIIVIQHYFIGLIPDTFQLTGFIIFTSITILSSRLLENSLDFSRKKEKDSKSANYRNNLYRDLFSHDINNILQNFQGFIDLFSLHLQNPYKFDTIEEVLKVANQQVYRGKNLVLNVRHLSELETEEHKLSVLDAFIILKQATKNLKEQFLEKNININIESFSENVYLKSNRMLIFIFENLLRNSILYNKNSSINIFIEITEDQIDNLKYITFKFIDNGIGIPDSQKDKVFLRGLRNDEIINGSGLGLTLVGKIVESYHGRLKVVNKVKGDYEQGSIFIIQIPKS